tara:strand:+ start:51 stop:524 length:474 start_codon:yes stop_codon:yes gene_type:complete
MIYTKTKIDGSIVVIDYKSKKQIYPKPIVERIKPMSLQNAIKFYRGNKNITVKNNIKVKDSNISDGFKYIYIFSNPAFPNQYKIGQSNNWKKRLISYQTADPNRGYKHEFSIETKGYWYVEHHTHMYFSANREWINADLEEIISKIKYYSKKFLGTI